MKTTNHLVFSCFDSPEAQQEAEKLSILVEAKDLLFSCLLFAFY